MQKTYVFLPPLKTPTGGMAVLHQVAAHLFEAGGKVFLVPRERSPWMPEYSRNVPVVHWDDLVLGEGDLWLVPEGWVNALAPGLQSGARTVLYVQNWAYLFSALPQGVGWNQLNVEFLAVSDPVARFIRDSVGADAPILRPGIDLELFRPAEGELAAKPVRVAYMPRKNKALAAQIRAVIEARGVRQAGAPPVVFEEIAGQTPEGVAEILQRSHIFLATGYPEGCPLPPLEAMACGCPVVGYGGLGGFDYMRQAEDVPGAYRPWFPLRDVEWGGNGLFAADADVMAAALALERMIGWVAAGDERYRNAVAEAQRTAAAYSVAHQREAVLDVWCGLAE